MKYLSICSGIEAATVAWHPLGWQPLAFSEIEPFPSAVLAHHWPDVPNLGDMTKFHEWRTIRPELIVGGTPCQAFSVAGLRKGLADPRGNLTLTFLAIVAQHRPAWVVWENVPGVLSDRTGAFGSFLSGLAELGYGWAYRVLDAQYFGVAQRRRRVFVVASLGGWGRAAAVLFERESMLWHPAPSRKEGKGVATGFECGPSGGGFTDLAPTLDTRCKDGPIRNQLGCGVIEPIFLDRATFNQGENAQFDPVIRQDGVSDALIARGPHAVAARMTAFGEYVEDETASCMKQRDYKDATDLVAVHGTQDPCVSTDTAFALGRNSGQENVVAVGVSESPDLAHCLRSGASKADKHESTTYVVASAVRRLTPTECERLQGFPDGHTAIPWRNKTADECPDGPRYKALGNSMAVPVMRWIGERIQYITEK